MKAKKVFSLTIAFLLMASELAFARVTTLWRATDTTYVISEHGDNYFADTYYGTCSVRGADRGINEDDRVVWYPWVSITYDVQGEIYKKTAWAGSKYNTRQVIERITVHDKWNNGPKTRVYYNYDDEIVDEEHGHSIGGEIKGGLLKEGKIYRTNKVLSQGVDKLGIFK
ncbi:MAG: hypothetical protein MSH08_07040 [Ezakiella sp.]|nr:hypothetical protein [Ezakiella sp.]MDD7472083.1 hypothetical protein [Bacillota bacterium]MDY3924046.1 hypothetical protein [Ezakiella sp.]